MSPFRKFIHQIRIHRHEGVGIWAFRYYKRWKKSQVSNSMKDEMPWISLRAVDFLEKNIRSDFKVFEYGGGGSTLYWSTRVAEVVTVEHDAEWFKHLETSMQSRKNVKWNGCFVGPQTGDLSPNPDPADPDLFSSDDLASKGKNYKDYVLTVDNYPNEYFDVVLIDGRSRASCLKYAFPKLKRGGWLILDNAERIYYTDLNTEIVNQMEMVVGGMCPGLFSVDFSETRIYRKK
ncbi:MAG: hypothetical protein K1X56_01895 [Flavobacteriales bacterium]|nr:hypothetical protein [Flavobacteriales bacterium]